MSTPMERIGARQTDVETLEGLLDRMGMVRLIEALGEIAAEKADHLRVNWQDRLSAQDWDRAATYLGKLSESRRFTVVSP